MEQPNVLKESFGTFLRNLWDLMILNWLWLLCSLPIVTIGPATCGLYSVTLKMARNESVSPAKDFFRGFRDNLKPGLVLGLLVLVLAVISVGDIYFALTQTQNFKGLFLAVGIIMAVIMLTLSAYGFALQAMFENPLKTQLLNVAKLAIVAPGKTLILWVILLIPLLMLLLLPPIALQMLGFLYILLGASGPVFACSHILRNLFDRVGQTAPQES